MTLREKLIVLRDKAGITQMALAHQLGVSRQAVTRWESGDTAPSMDKLKALAKIYELGADVIECSAEIALEHNLGLTCDPVLGLVQIPCIERNAMASTETFNAVMLAKSLESKHKVSFDQIVKVMYETGKDMNSGYRETSTGGLAKIYGK